MNFKTIMAVTMVVAALVCEGAESKSKSREETIDAVAATLWGEARGEGFDGLQMVASVIFNRANGKSERLYGVASKPKQFSCWTNGEKPKVVRRNAKDEKVWRWCVKIATAMYDGNFTSNTSATHYCTLTCNPRWAKRLTRVATIGKHKFYK